MPGDRRSAPADGPPLGYALAAPDGAAPLVASLREFLRAGRGSAASHQAEVTPEDRCRLREFGYTE